MYKICWRGRCNDMDVLAGFDAALHEGVDIISASLSGEPLDFFKDSIAIGAFHAQKKNILVVAAAGNLGPTLSTVQNVAPWIMTVSASCIDRQFQTDIRLGNGMITTGTSINTFSPRKQIYPLTSGTQAAINGAPFGSASACDFRTLNRTAAEGKIIYCVGNNRPDLHFKIFLNRTGTETIMAIPDTDVAELFLIPAAVVSATKGSGIDHYINSTKNPSSSIYKTRTVNITAPFLASFSSRGPQNITPNILKPDVAAPGVAILAAYPELVPITGAYKFDNRFSKYNILSGTSMATPHVAAAAAYVKSFHPDWSPAAIKSALMTTATPMKIKKIEAELGSGSGQINPTAALDPGLVYELRRSSYIAFLCKQGYATATIRQLTGGKHLYNCSYFNYARGADGLNYPSIHLQLPNRNSDISAVFYRNVTNVGSPHSTYIAKLDSPEGLDVTVLPPTLSFHRLKQIRHFKAVLKGKFLKQTDWVPSASLEWSNFNHRVTSPILVYRGPKSNGLESFTFRFMVLCALKLIGNINMDFRKY